MWTDIFCYLLIVPCFGLLRSPHLKNVTKPDENKNPRINANPHHLKPKSGRSYAMRDADYLFATDNPVAYDMMEQTPMLKDVNDMELDNLQEIEPSLLKKLKSSRSQNRLRSGDYLYFEEAKDMPMSLLKSNKDDYFTDYNDPYDLQNIQRAKYNKFLKYMAQNPQVYRQFTKSKAGNYNNLLKRIVAELKITIANGMGSKWKRHDPDGFPEFSPEKSMQREIAKSKKLKAKSKFVKLSELYPDSDPGILVNTHESLPQFGKKQKYSNKFKMAAQGFSDSDMSPPYPYKKKSMCAGRNCNRSRSRSSLLKSKNAMNAESYIYMDNEPSPDYDWIIFNDNYMKKRGNDNANAWQTE